MPRRKIQRAFLSWLEANRGRLTLDITLGKRTDTVQEFSFAGINPAISGALTTYEIEVWAIHDDYCWDILFNVDAEPKRVPGGGYVCDLCRPDARRVFADRPALWTDHLFEGLLVWVNDNLARVEMAGALWHLRAFELGAAATGRRSLANAGWRRPDP